MPKYTNADFKSIFKSTFNKETWIELLRNLFSDARESRILVDWEILENSQDDIVGYHIGAINNTDNYSIGLFYYDILHGSVEKKKVGLRNLVKGFINPKWGVYDAALVVFNSGSSWRLSLISDICGEKTEPKRYTYILGKEDLTYRTPISRFAKIQEKGASFSNLVEAFSVEALSEEFFNKYRELYADFVQYITGSRYEKVSGKWQEVKKHEPNEMFARAFGNNGKRVRDYIKKMMGRITFLHFLQRKGWMTGDLNYMWNLFDRSGQRDNYLDAVLEPLFFGIMNTKPEERETVFRREGWALELLEEWKNIPYLNGGLFERECDDVPETLFPENYFTRLLKFFGEYNFTIDENDPNDAEIGVDPEMLGKIFENLLEDNKDKGAFYTPKEIVQYMCRESLIAYLHKTTEFSLSNIRAFVANPEEGVAALTIQQREKVLAALVRVKICDPAIGSGAFPMGLLNELLRCRESLSDTLLDRAELKKSIISNNIYGVDIEKGAVDIARLRFWLSIVVDEDEPSPLPNLDYKIMQGDSLRESYMGCDLSRLGQKPGRKNGRQKSFGFASEPIQTEFVFDESRAQEKMQELIRAYFNISSHREKENVRFAITSTIREYIRFSGEGTSPAIQEALTSIDIPNNQFFLWHTFFGDVLGKQKNAGFDIIIGNPPYIQLQENEGYLGNLYKSCGFKSFAKSGDIYCLFYEQAWNLLREGGHLCFITSNKWMRAAYGQALRSFLAEKTNPKLLIDCGGYQVFKNATVDTNILLFSKDTNQGKTLSITLPKSGVDNLSDFVQHNAVKCSFASSDSWIILSPIEQSIKNKIEAIGTPLKEWDIQIYRGVLTGYNEAFIVTTAKRDEILSNCKTSEEREKTADLIRPILRGRDIKRYGYTWADLWLIATFPACHYNIEDYPAVKEYLLSVGKERLEQTGTTHIIEGERVKSRKKTNNAWFETQDSISYWEDFSKPKIVWAETMRRHRTVEERFPRFSYDEEGFFLDKTCFMAISNDADFIVVFLNSYIGEYLCGKYVSILDNGGYLMQKIYLENIPVPHFDDSIVEKIASLKNTDEDALETYLAQIIGFTDEEYAYIRENTGKL